MRDYGLAYSALDGPSSDYLGCKFVKLAASESQNVLLEHLVQAILPILIKFELGISVDWHSAQFLDSSNAFLFFVLFF